MRQTEFGWKSPSGVTIYAQSWMPDTKKHKQPLAIMLLIHGLGEHSSRYAHVAEYFTHHGLGILTCDRVGHGRSGGKRGHVKKYHYLFDDIQKLHSEATRRYPKTPVFLYGHSMGGGLVLDYLLQHPQSSFYGVVATSPMLEPAFEPNKAQLTLARFVRPFLGGLAQSNGLNKDFLSSDPSVVEAYINDPLVHSKITPETALGMIDSGQHSLQTVGKLSIPVLLLHGDQDGITSHRATQRFAEQAQGDVTLKIWKGGYHELHNEPDKMDVLDYLVRWVLKRARKNPR